MIKVIGKDGRADETLDPRLPAEELERLYKIMVLVRLFDQKAINLQRLGKIHLYGPCAGQEAVQIGSANAMLPQDWVFPYFREPGLCLLRGMSLKLLIAQLFGNNLDLCKGHNMPNMWADRRLKIVSSEAPIGAKIPVSVGVGLAIKLRREKEAVLAYFGDGATSAYGFHSGLNFAGVFKTPNVFFIQNNQYALSTSVRRQTASETLAVKAEAYGIRSERVDGNDILAVYSVTKRALNIARNGHEPTLIEAVTYRIGAHSTSDDPSRYRNESEVAEWRKKDPITRFRSYLERRGLWNEKMEAEIRSENERVLNETIQEVQSYPPPSPESLFEDVYSQPPWHLGEQRRELLGK